MKKNEIKEQIHFFQEALNRAIKSNDWVNAKHCALQIQDFSFLMIEQEDPSSFIFEAINNSASLHQAECPECSRPFSRGDMEGYHVCEGCGRSIHYRAFTNEEILESLVDDGE